MTKLMIPADVTPSDGHLSAIERMTPAMDRLSDKDILPSAIDFNTTTRQLDDIASDVNNDSKYWFCSNTKKGTIYIGLPPNNQDSLPSYQAENDGHFLNAALTLHNKENFLCWLEEWLKIPFDAEISHPPTLSEGVKIVIFDETIENKKPLEMILCIPLELLITLENPYLSMPGSHRFSWQSLNCIVDIAHFDIPVKQVDNLVNGGMLLIPHSFQDQWACTIKTIFPNLDGEDYFSARLDVNAFSLIDFSYHSKEESVGRVSHTTATLTETNHKKASLEFTQPHAIPVNYLMGWFESSESLNMFPLTHERSAPLALSHYEWLLKINSEVFATGNLLPIANGFGLLIKKCTH